MAAQKAQAQKPQPKHRHNTCVGCGTQIFNKVQCAPCFRKLNSAGGAPVGRGGSLQESVEHVSRQSTQVIHQHHYTQIPVYVPVRQAAQPAPQVVAVQAPAVKVAPAIQIQVSADGLTWYSIDMVAAGENRQVRMVQNNQDGSQTILPVKNAGVPHPHPPPQVQVSSEVAPSRFVEAEEENVVDRFLLIELD